MDNKYKDMEIKDICCEDCLFEELLEQVEKLKEYDCIRLFAKTDLVECVLRNFMTLEGYSMGLLDFDGMCGDYSDEYVVAINYNKEVYCEKTRFVKDKKEYLYNYDSGDIAYVYEEDVKQDIIDRLLDDRCDVVLFGFDEGNEEDFDDDYENDMQGFTETFSNGNSTTTYSFYSNIPNLAKDVHRMLHD